MENASLIRREGFLTILPGWRVAYVLTFAAKMIAYTILVARYEISKGGHDSSVGLAIAVAERDSTVTPGFVASTIILLEGVSYIMITYNYLYNKFVKSVIEGHKEEGREEGKTKMHKEWVGWNNRRVKAEEAGQTFDEPPPDAEDAR